ncbi:hypothetical protein ACI79C_05265 [Geodermatophilus sp. SYSU D00697]
MWVIGGLLAWVLLGLVVAMVLSRGVRIADERAGADPLTAEDRPVGGPAQARRRRIPLPPVGVGLAATAVLLETVGYVGRLTGASGPAARALSMDAPFSAPRMFVAALFVVAAVGALAGAVRQPGRRTWWLAVGLVAASIAVLKAGSTLHAEAMAGLTDLIGEAGAVVVSVLVVSAVLAVLAFVSRAERRDRRRVLGSLAAYAGAAVGLSAVSAAATGPWAVTATYLEESGEALAAVAVLVAVLVGVAPRLVLPASWLLRRATDAVALDAVDRRPGTARS